MSIKDIKKILYKDIDFRKLAKVKIRTKYKIKIKQTPGTFALLIVLVAIIGGGAGAILTNLYWQNHILDLSLLSERGASFIQKDAIVQNNYIPQTTEEEKTIIAVEKTAPSVVSIIITKDVPIFEKYYVDPFGPNSPFGGFQIPQYREKGTEEKQIGGGTGFIISKDGMILTNKHVTLEQDAGYTVFLNDGRKYPAKILAKDPFYDLAILKIEQSDISEEEKEEFSPVTLGDSSKLRTGQTVIAIGNALGEFQNTVSVGVISGLGRNITAIGDSGFTETLEGIIQTDAAINPGNSGGPLLNLASEVIGINVARSTTGENIGFSLPINMAKRDIEQVKATGTIIYPFLGIYYTMITEEISKANDLSVDYGAWIGRDGQGQETEIAVFPDSPAQEIGLERNDIILEFDSKKMTQENSLAKVILQYSPGDKIFLKILRGDQEIFREITLSERKD